MESKIENMEFKIENFPPEEINEYGEVSKVIHHSKNRDMYYFYTKDYGYTFKENKETKILEEQCEKRKLTSKEKEIVKKKIEQKERNNKIIENFKKSLPLIEAFHSSVQCGSRSEDQGRGVL